MNEVIVTVELEVHPTEDLEKVKTSANNLFWNIDFEYTQHRGKIILCGKATGRDSLSKLYNLLRRERILNSARRVLAQGIDAKTITFFLNKQVAYVGHLSFSEPEAESPLGPIKVQIKCDNPRILLDWLTPNTR